MVVYENGWFLERLENYLSPVDGGSGDRLKESSALRAGDVCSGPDFCLMPVLKNVESYNRPIPSVAVHLEPDVSRY